MFSFPGLAAGASPSKMVPPRGASLVPPPKGGSPTTTTTRLLGHSKYKYDEMYLTDKRLRSGSYGTVYTCHYRGEEENGGRNTHTAAATNHDNDNTTTTPQEEKDNKVVPSLAVKVIDRQKLKKKDDEGIFREVQILQEFMGVPNIIQLVDFFVEPDRLYVVQNYAAGGDVFDKLAQRKTYSEQDARVLARVLLQAMDALHHASVVHRDLKPENLLLANPADDTSILVADFGFARHVNTNDNGCKTRCGTPAFVAPEVVLGIPYGVAVDMWSIGCLLYMLIGGYPPFAGKNHRELFRKIRAADFVFHEAYFGKVSDSAKNLISHLLTVNKDYRWTARQCLASPWFSESAEHLQSNDLRDTIQELKRFKARRSWKAARVVIKWASTQPFWKPDAVSFAEQVSAWDKEVLAAQKAAATSPQSSTSNVGGGSTATLSSIMSHIPRLKFADLYELTTQIRKGSYAVVYRAAHKQTGEIYAVKVVQRQGLKPADDEAVMNEVAIMQQLAGKKHFCQLIDFYEETDAFYLVMEYMDGGDVFDQVVKKTHYTEKDARDLVAILLKAVSTLHDLGIAHRGEWFWWKSSSVCK